MIKNVEKKKKLAYYSFWMYNYASIPEKLRRKNFTLDKNRYMMVTVHTASCTLLHGVRPIK